MVITNTTKKDTYTGDGTTTQYSITIPFFASADVKAELDGVVTAAFTVTPGTLTDGHYDNGTLDFTTAPGSGVAIEIYIDTPATQEDIDTDATNTIDVEDIEQSLDRMALINRDTRRYGDKTSASATAAAASASASATAAAASETAAATSATASAASATASAASATSASTSATAAAASETAAATSATASAASATDSAASAASASAIANGQLPYASVTGSFTAINEGAYYVDDSITITLPTIGTGVYFAILAKSGSLDVTLDYTSNTINGHSEDVDLKGAKSALVYSDDGTTWQVTQTVPLLTLDSTDSVASKSSAYTLVESDDTITVDASGGVVTITLYAAASGSKKHNIVKSDSSANEVIINPNGVETINGASTHSLYLQYEGATIQSSGSEWFIL